MGLIGSNGAGKTTFVNMITGYLKPDAGQIELEGTTSPRSAPRDIERLGVARSFQIPQLCAEMSVLDNMLVAAACGGELAFASGSPRHTEAARARAMRCCERFALDRARRAPRRRAAGRGAQAARHRHGAHAPAAPAAARRAHQRRVSVDEKFPMMETVMSAIGGETRSAATVLFVEHDMEIVTRYASRVVAFYSGRVLADGAPATVLADRRRAAPCHGRR